MRTFFALIAACLMATTSAAQSNEVVGSAIVDGKRVELLSNNTWRYAEIGASNSDCEAVNAVLQVCGLTDRWSSLDTAGTEFIRQYRLDARTYAGIIYEELGANDGLTAEFMRSAVIENAARFTGVRAEDIPVLSVDPITVDDNPAEQVNYAAIFNGLDIVYQNAIVNAPNHNIQVVVWSVGKTLTNDARAANDELLSAMRIDFPGN